MPREAKARSGRPDGTNATKAAPILNAPSSSSSSASTTANVQGQNQTDITIPAHSAHIVHPHVRNLVSNPSSRSRSSSLALMGQPVSRSPSPAGPPATSGSPQLHRGIAATGFKLKNALVGRRKNKSEDVTKAFAGSASVDQEYHTDSDAAQVKTSGAGRFKRTKLTFQLGHSALSGGRKSADEVVSTPPPVPPKTPPKVAVSPPHESGPRGSIIAVSPGMSSALNFMRMDDIEREQDAQARRREGTKATKESQAEKEQWRRSDSTVSHHTIRPGAQGPRTSRPVSMAESVQSIHTIVPTSKRLSALLTDADYVMAEEELPQEDEDIVSIETPVLVPQRRPTTASASIKSKHRRSMSLNLGFALGRLQSPAPPSSAPAVVTDTKLPSRSLDESHRPISPSTSTETPALSPTSASGFIAPSNSNGNNIRGRLAAWSATSHAVNPSPTRYPSPAPSARSTRQPAISITGGFGMAKRAVEKMNRAWGGFGHGNVTNHSSTSISTAPSSYSDHHLARINSNQSSSLSSRAGKKSRRTPDAPSGAWSINSASSSASDRDGFGAPVAPYLGRTLRGPLRPKGTGSVVFGRDLKTVTREAGVGRRIDFNSIDLVALLGAQHASIVDKEVLQALEQRRLPALVVRCAQHIILWGIQEEGLFRVSGRSSHVNKLRAEFDTGADFDMTACSPGEIDPHAVASIFKAYLRELPEPILTSALLPYFEAALNQENATNKDVQVLEELARGGASRPGLPSGPRRSTQALRKPPSLSTLAMPSFAGMRPPSRAFINALKALLHQLPAENRDLIQTVTELINATALDTKATKMPLSNLLLIFCPSLNMNPPLLKVLCESEAIWDSTPIESPVLDIKRSSIILDMASPAQQSSENDTIAVHRPSLDSSIHSNSSSSVDEHGRIARPRPQGPRRHPATYRTINQSQRSLASLDSRSTMDDTSSYSNNSPIPHSPSRNGLSSPPLLSSSSVESLATPESSSVNPSMSSIPFTNDPYTKNGPVSSPSVASSTSDLPLKERQISGPIHFPTLSAGDEARSVNPRRSIPLLAFPGRSSDSPPLTRHRMKKPSLTLLFKRSASPLQASPSSGRPYISSPYLQTHSASESSLSSPVSATRTALEPPILNTTIESSPLREDLGLPCSPPAASAMPAESAPEEKVKTRPRSGSTPIADRYRASSNPLPAESSPSHLRPHVTRNFSKSSGSSNHLGLMDDGDREDWTQSVLLAADGDSTKWSFSMM
ncbi:RhoGAP-domain-containing protein [Cylindrobasidium torrendii FP15055 ss-10]|uniref:RhoGAP-domain-containing protein n=1 Tax=Cylindrobasidium torrendii FP15055 ss-10 TaxID=1314674 RepID=A0A0D7BHG8_9AGAR|nr:RhoGAP-domain-containing protein [Cylindrobasidium torrendii FP15055 ss-10]